VQAAGVDNAVAAPAPHSPPLDVHDVIMRDAPPPARASVHAQKRPRGRPRRHSSAVVAAAASSAFTHSVPQPENEDVDGNNGEKWTATRGGRRTRKHQWKEEVGSEDSDDDYRP
jgi:hypothetical protein